VWEYLIECTGLEWDPNEVCLRISIDGHEFCRDTNSVVIGQVIWHKNSAKDHKKVFTPDRVSSLAIIGNTNTMKSTEPDTNMQNAEATINQNDADANFDNDPAEKLRQFQRLCFKFNCCATGAISLRRRNRSLRADKTGRVVTLRRRARSICTEL
jgi:hypothetical protein